MRRVGLPLSITVDPEVGPQLLKKLSFDTWEDMYAAIGYGGLTAVKAVGRIRDDINRALKVQQNDKLQHNSLLRSLAEQDPARKSRHAVNGVIVEDIDSCMIKFAKCCTPVPGDPIIGFITRGYGVSVHRSDCPNTANREEPHQSARWVRVHWANQAEQPFDTTLELDCITRDGLLLDVATVMTATRVRVKELMGRDIPGGRSVFTVRFEVRNVQELDLIRNKLLNIPDVVGARRGQN
jgi:GTP pyrophosphokinase